MLPQFWSCHRSPSFLFVVLLAAALGMTACGSSSSSNNNQTPPPPVTKNSTVQINIGDSPCDRVVAFVTNITSMMLNNSDGTSASVISSSTPFEIMRLADTMQPMNVLTIPQGTYTGASITMASMSATYMDPTSHSILQKTIAGPITTNVSFGQNMILGSTPMVLSFDMDMANSINIDGSGNVTLTPTFQTFMNNVDTASGADPENGMMEHLVGSVASTSGNNFGMSMMQSAQPLSFTTNSGTQFVNMGGMGIMSNGVLVMVDAMLQADGTILAQKVQWGMGNGGVMSDGIVANVTGAPPTQIGLVVQNGSGQGLMSSFFSNNVTINVGGSTVYGMNTDDMDMSNLPFTPTFDPSHIYPGERIRCFSSSGMGSGGMGGMGGGGMMGTLTASECDLAQQGFRGTVSNYSSSGGQATFTMTLASDCYFAVMTGASTVTVYQQPDTELYGLTSIANGQSVEVRGLMFNDSGTYRMVARRILTP
ncbi:MAG TPA: DUF5666 domain-containing protein [Candidatus Sulfotelmatobacter sp.]|nr:DUF5666 domain-containing protein [Candidatus Sulfotelmatobacter sp.]